MRVNGTQGLVLGFFALVWVSLASLVVAAPQIYEEAMRTPNGVKAPGLALLAVVSALLLLLGIGVVRRWRWTFWLILVAFVAGILRVPVAILEFLGLLRTTDLTWYVLCQMFLGLLQFAIGLRLLASYRRGGAWAGL